MAYDRTGLFHVQMIATLEYAYDQDVDLEDWETTVLIDGREVRVEAIFDRVRKVVELSAFRKELGSKQRADLNHPVLKLKFVTLFETLTMIWDRTAGTIDITSATNILETYPKLTYSHLLDVVTKAIGHSYESGSVRAKQNR